MKSHFCRIVALFLSFALFIGIPQFSVVATLIERDQTVTQTNNAATDNAVSAEDEKTAVIVGEDESLRTENVRKFRLSDGSYIAAMYDDAVNYNDNGVWKEIDNTLCLKDGYYTNKANNFKVSLPAGLSDNTGISIGYGEYKLSFSPLNIKYTDVKVTQPEESKLDLLKKRASELAIQTEKGVSTNRSEISGLDDAVLSMDEKELKKAINNAYMSANKTESSVKYASVHSGVDIGYSLQSDKLKESIVLNSAGAEKDFRFLINANGFNAELAKDGSVLFKDGEKTIFTIASPYMWDANGEYSRDIKVSLDKTDGGYTYTLVPSEDWLRDPGRAYPVTVDPTFQYGDFYSVTDKTCTFVNPLTTSDRNKLVNETFLLRVGKFYGGTEAGSLIYADVLNGLNLGDARIVNAQMVLKFYGYYNAANLHLNAYRVTTPVSTWGNLSDPIFPSTLSISYDSSQIFDYIVTPADTSGLHNATCVFDITNLAWQWQNGTANNGVLLRATNFPSYGDRLVTFYDSSCGGASTDPKFVITYRNTEGLENYWTYHSQDVGRAGTGYINDYKGNLIFIHNDVTTTGNKMPISINHVYNSTNNDMNIGLGCGWSLSSYEYVKCVNDIPGYPMKYVDADGTTHYFADIGNNKSEDEDGLGLTLEYFPNNPTERTYIITDKNNNKKEFSANGPLMKVIDSNGNYYTQSYQTINGLCRLVSVTDGAGRVTTLNYNGNAKLVSIVDPSNRTTQYTYDTTGNYLVSITYPDNEVTHYEYNGPGGRLSRAINCDQYRIDYNYSTIAPYRMYWIDEANGSNVGFILYMSYGYNETYFDENNRRTTYQFNNFGQTVCIEDNEGKAQYYKMGAPGGSGGAANKVTFASKLQKTTSNLLKNHSFEFANSGEWIESTWNLNNGSRSFNGEGYIGSHSARCISYDTDACFSGYRQCYNAQPNTKYTFSAYVKLKSYTDYFGWHYGALVQINTDSGCVESEKITTVSDDWVRISATCTTGATVSYFYVEFGIEHAYGEALFDCMQLEAGETVNRYNLLENSALEFSSGSLPQYWSTWQNNGNDHYLPSVGRSSSMGYVINGEYGLNKQLYQVVNISGKANDSIVYSGWAKGNSIPLNRDYVYFEVCICIHYTDGTDGWFAVAFNFGTREWQYASDVVIAAKDYSSITYMFVYNNNANLAIFDDGQMYKEEFGQSYTYDNNGNIVSTKDLAKQNTTFAYTNNNLNNIVNPDGTSYEYQYDSCKRVTSARSSEGVKYIFTYDSFGNATTATVQNDSSSQSITAGKSYFIRNKNSGKYLDVSNGNDTNGTSVQQYQFGGTSNQKWRVEAAGNGYYYLVPLHSTTNKVLDVPGNNSANGVVLNIYDRNGTDAQKFKIIPNDDGSYRILTKSSSDASSITIAGGDTNNGTQATQWGYGEGNDQKWYFEDTEQPTVSGPTDSDVYFIRSRNSGQYLDVDHIQDENGTAIIQCYFNGGKNQQFKLISTGDGYYKIAPLHSTTGKVLDVTGGSNANSVYIQLYSDNNSDAQKFKFISNGNGTYRIVSKCSNDEKCLDVENVSFNAGTRIQQYAYEGGLNQQWIFEKVSDKIITSSTYTANGNYLASLTDARGETTSYSYDSQKGTLDSVTDPKGYTTNYTYNQNTDALEAISNGDNTISVSYTYDSYKLNTIVHNGFVYDFDYDWAGNNVAFKVGNQTLITNIYNYSKELLTRSNYGNGQYVEYEYDSSDRVSRKKTNGSTRFEYVYDAEGNLGILKDYVNSNTIKYTYDLSGRLTRIANSNGFAVQVNYDAQSRVSGYVQKLGTSGNTVGYQYGDVGAINPSSGCRDEKAGLIYGVTLNGAQKISYEYDSLSRLSSKTLNTANPYTTYYSYLAGAASGTTTTMLAGIRNGTDPEISYTYDANGNITVIKEGGVLRATYAYDNQNQLVRENNGYTGKTVTYSYDAGGNITLKSEYAYTTGNLGTPTRTYSYQYGDNNWKDKLTSYDGKAFTYDAIGNPLTFDGWTFSWENGRQLAGMSKTGTTTSYKYNDGGIRTQKTVNGVTTNYYLDGTRIAYETNGTDTIYYLRDENGTEIGFTLNGAEYYYVRNGQGDVIGILDSNGSRVVSYVYDSWGAPVSITGTLAATVGQKNPIRYRGYYYDVESGFFYVGSRYYDPQTCRFINADDTDTLLCSPNELTDKNLFAYCDNNPVMRTDHGGDFWMLIGAAVGAVVGGAVSAISQYATTGKVNWGVVGVNAAAGAISGALASTGIGIVASVSINAALGGGTYAAEQAVKGEKITAGGMVASVVAGGIGGAIGGKGANAKGLSAAWKSASKGISRELRRANVKYATKQIAKYTAEKVSIKVSTKIAIGRLVTGSVGNAFARYKFGY